MPTQREIEEEKLNEDGSSTDGCLSTLFSVSISIALILALIFASPAHASKPAPDKQKRTPITVYVYCTDPSGHRYPARIGPNGFICP